MATSVTSTGITFPDATTQTTAAASEFTSGTVMLFAQTTAPTGWTKDTTNYNNSGLRVVTGTASTGGSVDFTTAFASKAVTGTVTVTASTGQTSAPVSIGATTLTTPQIPSHNHSLNLSQYGGNKAAGVGDNTNATSNQAIGPAGGGGSHTHPGTATQHSHPVSAPASFSGTAINLAVKYVDVIRATKN
jgi:hypothetical protein